VAGEKTGLAGRIDNAAHDAAVAKVSEAFSHAQEIRSHLELILASEAFRNSRRCQEFVSHIVEHALTGDFDAIKERMLGIAIFGRKASYDTNDDSIVRVTASDVRRRLLRYYETSPPSPLQIKLPSGSYVPEFLFALEDPADPYRPESALAADRVLAIAPPPDVSTTIADWSKEAGESELPLPPSTAARPRLGLVLLIGLLCLVFLAAGLGIGALYLKPASRSPVHADPQYAFYKELLGPIAMDPQRETKIVLSNPLLFVYRGMDTPTPDANADSGEKKIPVPRNLAPYLADGADDPGVQSLYHYLALTRTRYTGVGGAHSAFVLEGLFNELDRSAQLTEARFLNWKVARDQHLILLGARHMNPWTQPDLPNANFQMERTLIRNLRPQAGEQNIYKQKFDGRMLEDYGLIWMSQSPSGSRILVLAALTSVGTGGVGDFFADPVQMKPIFEKLKAASRSSTLPSNWQVLLRINLRDDVPLNISFVALRILDPSK
jgi:hypothetical protein